MKKLLKKIIPKKYLFKIKIFLYLFRFSGQKSYAQEGEDLVLDRLMGEGRQPGFYVDVGAHHPVRFSNSYYFYRRGWRGINIDAAPGSMALFEWWRPQDINLEIAIGKQEETNDFFLFEEAALNTFSKGLADQYVREDQKITAISKTKVRPLGSVLAEFWPSGRKIDFMSIDIEGLDLEALKSNNWDKYRPEFILIEDLNFLIEQPTGSEIYNYLSERGYRLAAKTFNTLIFKSKT